MNRIEQEPLSLTLPSCSSCSSCSSCPAFQLQLQAEEKTFDRINRMDRMGKKCRTQASTVPDSVMSSDLTRPSCSSCPVFLPWRSSLCAHALRSFVTVFEKAGTKKVTARFDLKHSEGRLRCAYRAGVVPRGRQEVPITRWHTAVWLWDLFQDCEKQDVSLKALQGCIHGRS
jgi:hypothetical protein